MRLQEFLKKWDTGKIIKVPGIIQSADPPIEIEVNRPEHKTGLGELIKEYHAHLSIYKPFRDHNWKFIEKKLRGYLNQIEITWPGGL